MAISSKIKLLAGVAAVGFAFGAGQAQAGALAQSVLDISNFQITDTSGTALLASDFSVIIGKDTTDASVAFNALNASDTGTVFFPVTTLDMNQVCVANCAGFGQNDYSTRAAFGETQNVARGDTYLAGSPINVGGPVGATARHVSEVQSLGGNGSSQVNLGLQSSFSFVLGKSMAVGFSFDALEYIVTSLATNANPGSGAQASTNISFTIRQGGTTVFSWSPDGVVSGSETADDCNLNNTLSTLLPGVGYTENCTGFFQNFTPVLTAGVVYELNIRSGTDADASFIPEPGVLALLGIGMLGMGAIARRRKAA